MNIKGQDCEKCKAEIGNENYVICWDGISSKQVTFHKRCMPQDADTQKNHHIGLNPAQFGLTLKGLG